MYGNIKVFAVDLEFYVIIEKYIISIKKFLISV